jgi:hypothetical protein
MQGKCVPLMVIDTFNFCNPAHQKIPGDYQFTDPAYIPGGNAPQCPDLLLRGISRRYKEIMYG